MAYDCNAERSSEDLYMTNFLPGAASLLEQLDRKLMVSLRDGKTLIGYLRSIDQFANLVLHRTTERVHFGDKYGDIPVGNVIVRGENVVLLGEIDPLKENTCGLQEVSIEEILEVQSLEQNFIKEKNRIRTKALKERGLGYLVDYVLEEY